MNSIPVEQAEGHLAEIIETLVPGEQILLTKGNRPVATLRATWPNRQPHFGTLRGSIVAIAPDFDAILEEFEDYLP
jgi:antitoxin (DNA-binding transcriptional repressor) of toxin-antitoxin stability system